MTHELAVGFLLVGMWVGYGAPPPNSIDTNISEDGNALNTAVVPLVKFRSIEECLQEAVIRGRPTYLFNARHVYIKYTCFGYNSEYLYVEDAP